MTNRYRSSNPTVIRPDIFEDDRRLDETFDGLISRGVDTIIVDINNGTADRLKPSKTEPHLFEDYCRDFFYLLFTSRFGSGPDWRFIGGKNGIIVDRAMLQLRLRKPFQDFIYIPEQPRIFSDLDRYAAENPGKPVSDFLMQRYPGIEKFAASLTLESDLPNVDGPKWTDRISNHASSKDQLIPTDAPIKWSDRHGHDELSTTSEADFILKVYKDFLGKGMTTGTLNDIDPYLYRQHNKLPEDQKVPASVLPRRKSPGKSEADLRERYEKDRASNRERQARFRARGKEAQRSR